MPRSFFDYRLGQAPVFNDMSRYQSIIGDYLITVKLDTKTAQDVNDLFDSTHTARDLKFQTIFRVLNSPGKLSLKLEHNPTKAGSYTRKFQRFFGISST